MLSALLAAADPSSSFLNWDNPLLLGPIAAFVFAIFVSEVVVPGRTHKREVEENIRLRSVVERVIPLAAKMVDATNEMLEVSKSVTQVMEDVVDALDELDDRRRR